GEPTRRRQEEPFEAAFTDKARGWGQLAANCAGRTDNQYILRPCHPDKTNASLLFQVGVRMEWREHPLGSTQQKHNAALAPFRLVDSSQTHARRCRERAEALQGFQVDGEALQRGKEVQSFYGTGQFGWIVTRRVAACAQQAIRQIAKHPGRLPPSQLAQCAQVLQKRRDPTLDTL